MKIERTLYTFKSNRSIELSVISSFIDLIKRRCRISMDRDKFVRRIERFSPHFSIIIKRRIIVRWSSVWEKWIRVKSMNIVFEIERWSRRRWMSVLLVLHRIIVWKFSPRVVIISMKINFGKRSDWRWVRRCFGFSFVTFALKLGRTVDRWKSNSMFFNTFNNICRWFSRFASADQLELCFRQCRFYEKFNDLHHIDHSDDSFSSFVDLCAIPRQKRYWKSLLKFRFWIFDRFRFSVGRDAVTR